MPPVDLDVLRLDLDRKWTACGWAKQCERIAQTLHHALVVVDSVEVRETRKGFHVRITLARPLDSTIELVALQAILGSDAIREALNLARARAGRLDDWNLLFETKGERTTKLRLDYGGMLIQALRRVGMKPRLDAPRGIDWQPAQSKKNRVPAGSEKP